MEMKESLEQEYVTLARSMDFDAVSIDRKREEHIIEEISRTAALTHSALALYDATRMEHIYESPAHNECFRNSDGTYDGIVIHPDDYVQVLKGGIAATKFVFRGNRNAIDLKMIREYRAFAYGKFRKITEQFIPLETDSHGNPWLQLSVTDIAVDQSSSGIVKTIIIDTTSGDVFPLSDSLYSSEEILSKREKEVLRLVADGKLSKEIADILKISEATVNTHRQHILQHLSANNSMEAVRHAKSLGLI